MIDVFIAVVPADMLEEANLHCTQCKTMLKDACFGDDGYYCEECIKVVISFFQIEAEVYAFNNCKITSPLLKFDKSLEYRCTPEEYESGANESFTEKSVCCHNRHTCTNYDSLIASLDKDSLRDRVYYAVIRERTEQLIEEELERQEEEEGDRLFDDEEQGDLEE